MKKKYLMIYILMLIASSNICAGDFKRFELQPFGGATLTGGIPLESSNNVNLGTIQVDNSYNAGVTFGVNLNEEDAVEALWRRMVTKGRLPADVVDPGSSLNGTLFNLKIDQYHCNFLHHYTLNDPKAFPYVIGGVGATTYYASQNGQTNSMTRFSFALGGGIKYFFADHFGLRGEARWAPTVLTASDSSFWCSIGGAGAQCVVRLQTTLQNQVDFTGGVIIRF